MAGDAPIDIPAPSLGPSAAHVKKIILRGSCPSPTAYRFAFLVAAAVALAALFCSLAIHDADAAVTIPAHIASESLHSEQELAPAAA